MNYQQSISQFLIVIQQPYIQMQKTIHHQLNCESNAYTLNLQRQNTSEINTIHPLITYNSTTQSIDMHQLSQQWSRGRVTKFVGLVEVKNKDYPVFKFQGSFNKQASILPGIYMTPNISFRSEISSHINDSAYLLVVQNTQKMGQKYQDLFSSIVMCLSNICVFDIGSKYLRANKNTQGRPNKINYIVMNSHSARQSPGQIYKASIVPSASSTSKMEISQRIDQSTFHKQISVILSDAKTSGYCVQQIWHCLQRILSCHVMCKNYVNFEEVHNKFMAEVRLMEHLSNNSKDYRLLTQNSTLLTPLQLQNLTSIIQNCKLLQFPQLPVNSTSVTNYACSSPTNQILSKTKNQIIQKLVSKNSSKQVLTAFLLDLKEKYFTTLQHQKENNHIIDQEQLNIKIDLCSTLLQQYAVEDIYGWAVFGDLVKKIGNIKNNGLKAIVSELEGVVSELRLKLAQANSTINKNNEIISKYQQKFLDFKQLNTKYQEKCSQILDLQSEIQSQSIYIKSLQTSVHVGEKSLQQSKACSHILQSQIKKSNYQIVSLESQLQESRKVIQSMEQTIKKLQNKLQCSQQLETKALKQIQNSQSAKEELKRYKGLVADLEAHFQMFKQCQVQKINFVLKRNMGKVQVLQREINRLQKQNQQFRTQVIKLEGEVSQQRARVRFCQDRAWMMSKKGQKQLNEADRNSSMDGDMGYNDSCAGISRTGQIEKVNGNGRLSMHQHSSSLSHVSVH